MPEFDEPIKPSGAPGGTAAGLQVGGFLGGIEQMQTGADNMLKTAKAGGFRCDPEGIKQLVKVCEDMIDQIEQSSKSFNRLCQEPKLGSSPYAQQVAAHVRESADGARGVVPQLKALQATLAKLTEALYHASGQYDKAEDLAKFKPTTVA